MSRHPSTKPQLKISILLPAYLTQPIGGYHVHYAYANMLTERGHDVSIVFARFPNERGSLHDRFDTLRWGWRNRLLHRPLTPFFPLHRKVRVRFVRSLQGPALPSADILIATAWDTAEKAKNAPARCGQKFYIAYDYEYLMTADPATKRKITSTYTYPFSIIATSTTGQNAITAAGGTITALIPCGLDFNAFRAEVAPEARTALTVGFPIRGESFKGTTDAIEAMRRLRERYGERLQVTGFGNHRMELPSWITWLASPTGGQLLHFYNQQAVFLLPSHYEGWGLPAVEAMACGAALVTADNGGCRDYAFDHQTALVVPPQRPELLAQACATLLDQPELRARVANAGHQYVQRFTWQSAADRLEATLRAA